MENLKKLPKIVEQVFSLLNEKQYPYAVLRNYEGLPQYNRSRDIDILIAPTYYNSIKKDVVSCLIENGFYIITLFESERLRTIVCGKIINGDIEIIQFDFFIHTSAYGNIIIKAEDMLATREIENNVYHVSREYQFLDKYLYIKYVGAEYPQKYHHILEEMKQSSQIVKFLSRYNISSVDQLIEMPTKKFRKIISQKVGKSYTNRISFWCHYIANQLSYRGFSFGFTGPDGVGKTTIINEVNKVLSAIYKVNEYHFRPMMFGNLSEVAHSAGIKKNVDRNYQKPHRGGKTNAISSLLRLVYYSIDYVFGYIKSIRPLLVKRQIVIFDRYYTDIVCDSRRSRIFLNYKFLQWVGKIFIPALDYNILLTADTETILSRKQELDREGIDNINAKIDYLKNKKSYTKILNNGTPLEAVSKVITHIFSEQHRKNLKRLK